MSETEDPMDPASDAVSSVDNFDTVESFVRDLCKPTDGAVWAEAADWGIMIMDDEASEHSDWSEWCVVSATVILSRQNVFSK